MADDRARPTLTLEQEGALELARQAITGEARSSASWAAACTLAGLDGRIRHDFRRTAARDLLRAGVSVPTVMRAMGWASTVMLMRYAVGDEAELVEAGKKRAKLR